MIKLHTNELLYSNRFYHYNFIEELEVVFKTKFNILERKQKSEGIHLFFALGKWLHQNTEFIDNLKGPKFIIEHDGYLNFMKESPYYKAWDTLYHTTKFNLLISSGKKTTSKFIKNNIPAIWVPKGCDKKMLSLSNKETGNICSFGTSLAQLEIGKELFFYKERNKMNKIICSKVELFTSDVEQFCVKVCNYSAGCLNDATMEEPMSKHFECSAMGCVPIRDNHEELYELGYNQKCMITYNNLEELPTIINYYQKHPELLLPLQANAKIATKSNTWLNRANQIETIINQNLIKML